MRIQDANGIFSNIVNFNGVVPSPYPFSFNSSRETRRRIIHRVLVVGLTRQFLTTFLLD